jgi:diamine N-acetyltransferase
MIRFEKITDDNYGECIKLDPGEKGRKYVAPNVNSLAIAYVCKENNICTPMPFAIYNDEIMVGFIMMSSLKKDQDNDFDEDTYDIWRFMVDKKYQGKGYGREALLKAIEFIKSFPYGPAKTLVLSYLPENEAGSSLYESVGFKATGEIEEGEIVMAYDLIE